MNRSGMNPAFILGKLVITSCLQTSGAPLVDKSFTEDNYGRHYKSIAILLTPWKRDKFGDSLSQKCLVIGWRE